MIDRLLIREDTHIFFSGRTTKVRVTPSPLSGPNTKKNFFYVRLSLCNIDNIDPPQSRGLCL